MVDANTEFLISVGWTIGRNPVNARVNVEAIPNIGVVVQVGRY